MSKYILPLAKSIVESDALQELIQTSITYLDDSKSTLYLLLLFKPHDFEECQIVLDKVYNATRKAFGRIDIEIKYYVVFSDILQSSSIIFDKVFAPQGIELPQTLHSISTINIEFSTIDSRPKQSHEELAEQGVSAKESQYCTVAVGGTFDHLHDGHKILLTVSAYLAAEKLVVGVTIDELLVNKKYKDVLQPYKYRVSAVRSMVALIKPNLPVEFHQLRDICGPTAVVKEINALILSSETASGGEYINKVRTEKGFPELDIVEVSVIGGGSKDDGWKNKLSSTEFRRIEYEKLQKLSEN